MLAHRESKGLHKNQSEIAYKSQRVCHERRAVGRQSRLLSGERQQKGECQIVSPMCKGACVRDGTHGQITLKLMDFPKTMNVKEGSPLAAFHIAYVAMGLTIRQGGW
jgi:hypothetical protein